MNGKFKSLNDFISRVNPKDMNKLQLEGLVKSGAFDEINSNRASINNSIPNLILKSKNLLENKLANQIDLFKSENVSDVEIIEKTEDWKFQERLSKEFESIGFFISDHPLNAFKDIFDEFNILNYLQFYNENSLKKANVAATVLKVLERKTNKGLTYAIIKFSDLTTVFELFVFSEVLQSNREILKEGNSLLLELNKTTVDEIKNTKRINLSKISLMKNITDKPISKVEFTLVNHKQVEELSKYINAYGSTEVKIKFKENGNSYIFNLENKRNIERKTIKLLKNYDISALIN